MILLISDLMSMHWCFAVIERTGSNLKDVKRETLPPQHSPMSRASTSFNSAAPPTTPALFLQVSIS